MASIYNTRKFTKKICRENIWYKSQTIRSHRNPMVLKNYFKNFGKRTSYKRVRKYIYCENGGNIDG